MVSVFYYDEETGDTIDSLQPEECFKQKALSLFNVLTQTPGSFFGLVNKDNSTLQFICEDEDTWRVEIPIPERDGVLFCYAKTETCKEFIKCVYENINIADYVQMDFN